LPIAVDTIAKAAGNEAKNTILNREGKIGRKDVRKLAEIGEFRF
jgi:hypothetical protein